MIQMMKRPQHIRRIYLYMYVCMYVCMFMYMTTDHDNLHGAEAMGLDAA